MEFVSSKLLKKCAFLLCYEKSVLLRMQVTLTLLPLLRRRPHLPNVHGGLIPLVLVSVLSLSISLAVTPFVVSSDALARNVFGASR